MDGSSILPIGSNLMCRNFKIYTSRVSLGEVGFIYKLAAAAAGGRTANCRCQLPTVLLCLLLTIANTFAQEIAPANPKANEKLVVPNYQIYWKNGFQFESEDKQFKLKFGGRINYDHAFFFQEDTFKKAFGPLSNGVEFRRIRLFHSGQIYYNVKYKIQFDFAGDSANAKDVWISLSKIPVIGNIKIGHFKEPFRLGVITSGKYITFMERATTLAFIPDRNSGLMVYDLALQSRLSWSLGIFRRADKFGNDKQADDEYNITARLTGLPIYNTEKKQLLHLGLAYSYRNPDANEYYIKSKPESHLANELLNTDTISNVDIINLFQTEAALVMGPFSLQGEFVSSVVKTNTDTLAINYTFAGYYAYVSYFLTGESRQYSTSLSAFSRVSPKKNFGSDGGLGAWEIGLRYSILDLDDKTIKGGTLNCITIGLNWYLNPSTRFMANYVLAQLNDVGSASIVQFRFHVDF
ncbi:MAG: hypothetical protein FVQ77_14875 [Cytophagales bacterium]|nr:hypothetical protein [Cytophagales bacterium]